MAQTEAQKEATRRYREKNKEKEYHAQLKRNAKSFIRNRATKDDIEEIRELCDKVLNEKFF